MSSLESDLEQIPINAIERCPYQPRRSFDEEEIQQLSDSIREVGLIQPMVVRKVGSGRYELIAGERRWRACLKAGLETVPVVVRTDSDSNAANAALVENIQRVDLNAMEVAHALQRLLDQQPLSQEQLAEKVGKKRSTVANYLRLLLLPDKIQTGIQTGKISMGHAKVILSLEGKEKQESLYTKILSRGLSVRETEQAALQFAKRPIRQQYVMPLGQNEHVRALEEGLQRELGTKVKIKGNLKGEIVIAYHNLDDLDRLLEKFGVEI